MPAPARPFRTFALPATAGLLLLASAAQAAGQDSAFSADAAIEIGTDEVSAMAGACAEDVDGEGHDVCSMPRTFTPRHADMYSRRPQPAVELARQELIPVGPYIRTCECSRAKTVVRARSVNVHVCWNIHEMHVCIATCDHGGPSRLHVLKTGTIESMWCTQ